MTYRYLERDALEALYGNSPDAIMVERFDAPYPLDAAKADPIKHEGIATIVYINPVFTELLTNYGLPVSEAKDNTALEDLLEANFNEQFRDRWQDRPQQRIDNLQLAAHSQDPDSQLPPLMLSTTAICHNGYVHGCWTRITDATPALGRDADERRALRQIDAFVRTENVPLICLEFATSLPMRVSSAELADAYQNSTITHVTNSAAQLTGVAPEQLVGSSLLQLNSAAISLLMQNAFPIEKSNDTLNLGDTPEILVDIPGQPPLIYRVKPTFVFENNQAMEVWLRIEDITSNELQARRQQALEQTRGLALEAANLYQFEADRISGELSIDNAGLLEMGITSNPKTLSEWRKLITPQNINISGDELQAIFDGKTRELNFIAKVPNDQGEDRFIEVWGLLNRQPDSQQPGRTIGLYRDATHGEQLNARLSEKKTLESLGVLAGGVAHDFNNLLMSVLGYAELMEADLLDTPQRDGSPLVQSSLHNINEIRAAALRASELCTSLLAYAGQHLIEKKSIDLTELVRTTAELMQVTVGKRAPLLLDLDNEVIIAADKGQLTQVIVNLVGNAADAMEGIGGAIQLGVATTVLTPQEQLQVSDQLEDPGERLACLTVRDNGCGMSAATQQRMFDPFYSTKSEGRGLGMAAVHGIVKNHGGVILVESRQQQGSEFRICFPLLARIPTAEHLVSETTPTAQAEAPKVLVVDDEAGVRTIAAEMLRHLSCEVLEADSAEAALALFANHRFDVALLDITMPVMSGSELAELLLERVPDLQVVLCSGYTEKDVPEALLKRCSFIHKPYTLKEISDALQLDKVTGQSPEPA